MPQPLLNPMHPPLAKQFIALSIRSFRRRAARLALSERGVRRARASSRCICAASRCSRRRGRRSPPRLLAFLNQMVFVQSRIAMLDIYRADVRSVRHRRVHARLPAAAAACLVRAWPVSPSASRRLQMERIVSARRLHRHRRRDPPDAGLAHAICRRQCRRLVPARSAGRTSGYYHFAALLRAGAGARLFRRPSFRSTAFRCRISSRRSAGSSATTPRPRSPATSLYELVAVLAAADAAGLVSVRQDRRRPFQAIVFLGNPLILWPALLALGDLPARLDRRRGARTHS